VRKCMRLIELRRLLGERPRTVGELGTALGCSTRTIARDLAELRALPGLTVDQDHLGRWRAMGDLDTAAVVLLCDQNRPKATRIGESAICPEQGKGLR